MEYELGDKGSESQVYSKVFRTTGRMKLSSAELGKSFTVFLYTKEIVSVSFLVL
jgi:hypothetical protein